MNKKALYAMDTLPFYILFGVVVSGLFIVFVFIVSNNSIRLVELPEGLDEYVLSQRFLRSPDCFVYEDVSGRTYPLIIDWDKFTQKNIENCYIADTSSALAFALRLSFSEEASKNIFTTNWNHEKEPDTSKAPLQVLVHYKNKKYLGKLTITIQNA